MATIGNRNRALFADTADSVRVETGNVENTVDRQGAILSRGESAARLTEAIGSQVATAVSIDDIRLSKMDIINRGTVKMELQSLQAKYQAELKAAGGNPSLMKKAKEEFDRALSKYATGTRGSNNRPNINNNRTMKWFKEEALPSLKTSSSTSLELAEIAAEEIDRQAQMKYTADQHKRRAMTEEAIKEANKYYTEAYTAEYGPEQAKAMIEEDTRLTAVSAATNDINTNFDQYVRMDGLQAAVKDMKGKVDSYTTKYGLFPEEKNQLHRMIDAAAKLHATREANAKKLANKELDDEYAELERQIETDNINAGHYAKRMMEIALTKRDGEYVYDADKRNRKWKYALAKADVTPKETKPLAKTLMTQTVTATADEMTFEEREAAREEAVIMGLNPEDNARWKEKNRNALKGANADAFKAFRNQMWAEVTGGGGIRVEGEMSKIEQLEERSGWANKFNPFYHLGKWMTEGTSQDMGVKRKIEGYILDYQQAKDAAEQKRVKERFNDLMVRVEDWTSNQVRQGKTVTTEEITKQFKQNINAIAAEHAEVLIEGDPWKFIALVDESLSKKAYAAQIDSDLAPNKAEQAAKVSRGMSMLQAIKTTNKRMNEREIIAAERKKKKQAKESPDARAE